MYELLQISEYILLIYADLSVFPISLRGYIPILHCKINIKQINIAMKKLLFLFAVLLTSVGAWAQPAVSDAPENGQWAANTTWYQLKLRNNRVVRADVLTAEGYLALTNTTVTNGDAGLWCIVGNANDGYKFYNRAKGANVFLGMKGDEGDGLAVFVDANTTGYTTAFDFVKSNNADYWCVKDHGTSNKHWNYRAPRLAYWNTSSAVGNDGSDFLFTPVAPSAIEGLANEEDITAAQALIKVAPGYPKTTSAQYHMLNVMVNSVGKGVVATELASAVTAYKTCSDIILPEDGKAYTIANYSLFEGGTTRYLNYTAGSALSAQSTDPEDASVFVCRELSAGVYAFVTDDGKVLAWPHSEEGYMGDGSFEGYSNNYATEYQGYFDWNKIAVKKNGNADSDFGHLRLVARRYYSAGKASEPNSSFIVNGKSGAWDRAGDSYFLQASNVNDNCFSSAWILTEVEHTNTAEQTAALAEIDATVEAIAHVDANASKLGTGIGYAHYVINETCNSNVTEIKSAICDAVTAGEILDIKNSYAFETPQVGTEYVLYDVAHKVFVDIHNLAKEPNDKSYDQLATLNSEKQVLYVTATDNRWKIHTTAEGGNFLGQYTSIRPWNSKVNEDQSNFSWLETPAISGNVILYTLQNTSGTYNGYLGNNGHANAGELYVNQTAEEMKLKLRLHEAALVYKVVTTETTGAAVYGGKNYVNGDYIFANAALTNADLVARHVPGKECTDIAIDEENKIVTLTYTIAANFKEGDKFFVKNIVYANDYIGVEFAGGKLGNTEAPTTKNLVHKTKNASNIDYKFCWELKATTHETEQCFYLYNPYYDWYIGSLRATNQHTYLSKTEEDAGKYKIEIEDNHFVFHCLTSNVVSNQLDCNFFHWYNEIGGAPIVGWARTSPASQWLVEEVTDEMETQWQNTLTSQYNTLTQHKIGTGVNQYSGMPENLVEGFNALELPEQTTAIEKARYCVYALYDYASAVEALVINQPAAGFYRIQSQNGNDNTKKGQYVQNYVDGTGLKLDRNIDAKSIMYIANDNMLSYASGLYVNDYDAEGGVGLIGEVGSVPTSWRIVENNDLIGTYALGGQDNYYLSDWLTGARTTYGNNDANAAWTFEPVEELPFTFNAEARGYATFHAPVAVELPDGVNAYIGKIVDGNKLKMRKFDEGKIPANTAVLLYNSDYANTPEVSLSIIETTGYTQDVLDDINDKDDFVGTVAAENLNAEKDCYSLQKSTATEGDSAGKMGFFKKTSGTKGGFKAWLEITKSASNARAFTIIFDGDDATGLKEALGLENENVEIYDLSGRRLDKPAKGVNVIGGKLVVK